MTMPRLIRWVSLLALVSPSLPLQGQSRVDPAGHWEGAIAAPSGEVRIEIDLGRRPAGELFGTLGNPARKLKGLPLAAVSADGDTVRFEIKGSSGSESFQGTLSPDGKTLTGEYSTQAGSAPASLARTGDARFEATPRSPAIAKQLEGTWTGMLVADGREMRLLLKMANHPDGTATGSLVSAEGMEIPITRITFEGASLRLDVSRVGGSYEGKLNAAGSELNGTWSQAQLVFPLAFERSGS
jgi:hypothetical protein